MSEMDNQQSSSPDEDLYVHMTSSEGMDAPVPSLIVRSRPNHISKKLQLPRPAMSVDLPFRAASCQPSVAPPASVVYTPRSTQLPIRPHPQPSAQNAPFAMLQSMSRDRSKDGAVLANWLNDQPIGFDPQTAMVTISKAGHVDDVDSEDSENTAKPLEQQRPECGSSYFWSDADDDENLRIEASGDQSTALPPDDPFIHHSATNWLFKNHDATTINLSDPRRFKHKVNLETIEKHWGGTVQEIFPTVIRPLAEQFDVRGVRAVTLLDPMDWDQRMVRTLRKAAVRGYLKGFNWFMQARLDGRRLYGGQQLGFTYEDVRAYYNGLKRQGLEPRDAVQLMVKGPAVEDPEVLKPYPSHGVADYFASRLGRPQPALPATSTELELSVPESEVSFWCDGCQTFYTQGAEHKCSMCELSFCGRCIGKVQKHEAEHFDGDQHAAANVSLENQNTTRDQAGDAEMQDVDKTGGRWVFKEVEEFCYECGFSEIARGGKYSCQVCQTVYCGECGDHGMLQEHAKEQCAPHVSLW